MVLFRFYENNSWDMDQQILLKWWTLIAIVYAEGQGTSFSSRQGVRVGLLLRNGLCYDTWVRA